MKLFMVADMEGATGITHRDQLLESGGKRYWDGCGLLTGDINAVVEGAVSEGVTEVIVSEGQGIACPSSQPDPAAFDAARSQRSGDSRP